MRPQLQHQLLAIVAGLVFTACYLLLTPIIRIMAHGYEDMLGGKQLPEITRIVLASHGLPLVAATIAVFSTSVFSYYIATLLLRRFLDLHIAAAMMATVSAGLISCYVITVALSLLLPFVSNVGGMRPSGYEKPPTDYSPLYWACAAVFYSVLLALIGKKLKWK